MGPGNRCEIDQCFHHGQASYRLAALTSSEKLDLIDQLWQSLGPDDFSLTDTQRQELDRRLDRLDREGPSTTSWPEVRERIEKVSK